MATHPTRKVEKSIDDAVAHFSTVRKRLEPAAIGLVEQIKAYPGLGEHVHFIKYRIKDPDHLKDKLKRKAFKTPDFVVNSENLFNVITDLIGIRILHLHSAQVPLIHKALLNLFADQLLNLVEEPFAICWDSEYKEFYESVGLKCRVDSSMYTSLHYTVEFSQAGKYRCEIQVRTLMDEVWGEVSHAVNYPAESPSESCRDQLRILARMSSGCVRLVDSIFKSDLSARDNVAASPRRSLKK